MNMPEGGMAIHCSILACRTPRTEESGRLQSTGSQRFGHDWLTKQQGEYNECPPPSFLLKTARNNRLMSLASSSEYPLMTEFLRQSLRISHALHCSNMGFSKCHSLKDNFETVKGHSLVLKSRHGWYSIWKLYMHESESRSVGSVVSDSLQPHGL